MSRRALEDRVVSLLVTGLLGLTSVACGTDVEDGVPGTETTGPPVHKTVTDSLLRTGHAGDPSAWPTYGGGLHHRRYSPLAQVDTTNVTALKPAWIYQTGVAETLETTPLVVGREMYLTVPATPESQAVVKLDAASGREIWRTEIALDEEQALGIPVNRGVSLYGDLVYLATVDARLAALDAETGRVVWQTRTADPNQGYTHTQAPLAYDGKVLIGSSGGTTLGIRGFVKAYEVSSGEHLWTWHSIPSPAEGGWWGEWLEHLPNRPDLDLNRDIARERADSAQFADAWRRGGGPVWMTPALDPGRGLLYISVGNPWPVFDGSVRPGDNRWTDSVCAVRLATGTTVWCRQVVPHDVWNLDIASPPFLFTARRDGRAVDAVGSFSKLGIFHAWERETGELLAMSDNYVPHENLFALPTPQGTRMAPGYWGGTNWSPVAYHPGTRKAYAANLHIPGEYVLEPTPREEIGPERWLSGRFEAAEGEARGNLTALEPGTGEIDWQWEAPRPMAVGLLATGGGLLFGGQLDGSFDAWNARTGEHLWSFTTGAGCASAPVTYRVDGTQYVVAGCGGHLLSEGPKGDVIVAFTLPSP